MRRANASEHHIVGRERVASDACCARAWAWVWQTLERTPAPVWLELGADVTRVHGLHAGTLAVKVVQRTLFAAHAAARAAHALAVLFRGELLGVLAKLPMSAHALERTLEICERAHDGRRWSVEGHLSRRAG